ncbi:MAG: DUF6356 family protein [Rhodovibrionaceae bacterium]|nr:DUF6356 family protein [Rhodovibrionaceae bacterium]
MKELFTKHPASVDETYGEHMVMAASFGGRMFLASLACFVHAVFPFLFERTGSKAISELYERMVTNRHKATRRAETSLGHPDAAAARGGR